MLRRLEKLPGSPDILLWHFLIFGTGLLKLIWLFSSFVSKHYMDTHSIAGQVCDWIAPFANDKLLKLLYFGCSLLVFGMYYFFYAILCNVTQNLKNPIFNKPYIAINYLLFILMLNLLLLNNNMPHTLFIFTILWVILFLMLPVWFGARIFYRDISFKAPTWSTRFSLQKSHYWRITALITFIFLFAFYPLIFKTLHIQNDFMDIPEQSILKTNTVDNAMYINTHHIGGFQLYDPRQIQDILPQSLKTWKPKIYTSEEKEFIRINQNEQEKKVKAGWFFFHHSWVLNPILALSLGADPHQQVFIYGWGSAAFLKNLLLSVGGIHFQSYFKIMFSFYPIYFLIFLAVIWKIFRRADMVCAGAILLSIGVFALSDELIRLAPGYNPIRHLFDMIILFLFFKYAQENKLEYWIGCIALSMLAIIWSKDFGIFVTLAVLIASFFKSIVNEKVTYKFLLIPLMGALAVFLYCLPLHGINYNFVYMLMGYTIPKTSIVCIFIILCAIQGGYIAYIKYKDKSSGYYWLSLCLFFYLQMQLIYYIWYPSYTHLLVASPTIIMLGLTWVRLSSSKLSGKNKNNILYMFGFLIAYSTVIGIFYWGRFQYEKTFSSHVVHEWKFEPAKFLTTMSPSLFDETISLIHSYAPGSAIYLLSKYDAIFPVLSQRYNALPVVNLSLDLIGESDIARCVHTIKMNKPTYLFMDTDILRDLSGDVAQKHDLLWGNLYKEAKGRYGALMNMRQLWWRIEKDYQIIKVGHLLTVYQRKK